MAMEVIAVITIIAVIIGLALTSSFFVFIAMKQEAADELDKNADPAEK